MIIITCRSSVKKAQGPTQMPLSVLREALSSLRQEKCKVGQIHKATQPLLGLCSAVSALFHDIFTLPSASAACTGDNKHQLSLESSVFLGQAHCLIGITRIFTSSAKPPRPRHLCLCATHHWEAKKAALKGKSLHNASIKRSQFHSAIAETKL